MLGVEVALETVGLRFMESLFCLPSQTIRLFAFANHQIVCIRKPSGLIGVHWFDLRSKSNKGPTELHTGAARIFFGCFTTKKGPTEIRTRITRFKVWGPNHWTIGPFLPKVGYRHHRFPTPKSFRRPKVAVMEPSLWLGSVSDTGS